MPNDLQERAERGASLLDTVHPGWHEDISVGTLDITLAGTCVLGQLYGSYRTGLDRVFTDPATNIQAESDQYGFSASWSSDMHVWGDLTQVWRDLIAERRCRALNVDLYNNMTEKVSVSV
jgi:hypothetical protein